MLIGHFLSPLSKPHKQTSIRGTHHDFFSLFCQWHQDSQETTRNHTPEPFPFSQELSPTFLQQSANLNTRSTADNYRNNLPAHSENGPEKDAIPTLRISPGLSPHGVELAALLPPRRQLHTACCYGRKTKHDDRVAVFTAGRHQPATLR